MHKLLYILFLSLILFVACKQKYSDTPQNQNSKNTERKNDEMKITSASFEEGGMIPSKYTCDGQNISPQLSWTGIPKGTKSVALLCDDPDAPVGDWVHWLIFNIPPLLTDLKENIHIGKNLENGAIQGLNDFKKNGYGGPCPPGETHRYFFKLYALDSILTEDPNMTKAKFLKEISGHILGEAQLMGKYKRK